MLKPCTAVCALTLSDWGSEVVCLACRYVQTWSFERGGG
jgi:hypothetical protein